MHNHHISAYLIHTADQIYAFISARKSLVIVLFLFLFTLLTRLLLICDIWYPFPLNDGGLFYEAVQLILRHHYTLPAFFEYNNAHIPFTYPPLGFYVSAFLTDVFRLPLLSVFAYLPIVISSLSVIPFFAFLRELGFNRKLSFLASLIMVSIPSGYYWLVMGGGITRSFGFLFMLTSLYLLVAYLKQKSSTTIFGVFAGVSIGLTVLSHLETTLLLAITILILFIGKIIPFHLRRVLFMILITFIVISPWLIIIYASHGFSPYYSAFVTNYLPSQTITVFFAFLQLHLVNEVAIPIFGTIALFGIIYMSARKKYFELAWVVAIFILMPRSVYNYIHLPIAIISAQLIYYLSELVNRDDRLLHRKLIEGSTIIFIVYMVITVITYQNSYGLAKLPKEDFESMRWIQENVSGENHFLVIDPDGFSQWGLDKTAEWFPALSGQISLSTIQGSEWLPNRVFKDMHQMNTLLNSCNFAIACLEAVVDEYDQSIDFIYLSRALAEKAQNGTFDYLAIQSEGLSRGYTLVYENQDQSVLVLKKRQE